MRRTYIYAAECIWCHSVIISEVSHSGTGGWLCGGCTH